MSRAVFLDRDGVINEVVVRDGVPSSPRTLDEFILFESLDESLRRLSDGGFRLFVVSNQPDVARGLLDPDVLTRMSDRICSKLPIEAVHACTHDGKRTWPT